METLRGYRTYIGFALYGLVKTVMDIDLDDGTADWLSEPAYDSILNSIIVLTGISLRAGIKASGPAK